MKLSQEEKELILKNREAQKSEEQKIYDDTLAGVLRSIERDRKDAARRLERRKVIAAEFIEHGIAADKVIIETRTRYTWVSDHNKELLGDDLPEDLSYQEYTLKVHDARIDLYDGKVESWSITGTMRKYTVKGMAKKIKEIEASKAAQMTRDARDKKYAEEAVKFVEKTYDTFRIDLNKVPGRWDRNYRHQMPDYWEIKVTFASGSFLTMKVRCFSDRYELEVMKVHDERYKTVRKPYEWMDEFQSQK